MKFSYVMLPDYPLEESLRAIKLADELGFHGCYAADETWHKDLWLLFAAAARDTTNIRFGPSLSGVVLREPTLIAQAAATLDELTNGRAAWREGSPPGFEAHFISSISLGRHVLSKNGWSGP